MAFGNPTANIGNFIKVGYVSSALKINSKEFNVNIGDNRAMLIGTLTNVVGYKASEFAGKYANRAFFKLVRQHKIMLNAGTGSYNQIPIYSNAIIIPILFKNGTTGFTNTNLMFNGYLDMYMETGLDIMFPKEKK